MNFIVGIATLLALTTVATGYSIFFENVSPHVVRLNEPLHITRKGKSLYSNVGIVSQVRQCGGTGKVLQWRSEACTLNTQGPCLYPAEQYYRGELTFAPSETTDSLGIRLILKDPSRNVDISAWQNPNVTDSRVEAGKEYSLLGGLATSSELRGKVITPQVTIYRESDKQIEICAEADFLIV